MTIVDAHRDAIEADLERRRNDKSLIEEGRELSRSLRRYVRACWHVLRPDDPFIDNWHIGAMCEKLEAIFALEIRNLFVWVPPGSMKTITGSIAFPTWVWTRRPSWRLMSGMYDMDMAVETGSIPARDLIQSGWYQDRWGHVFQLKEDQNKRAVYMNTRGGARFCIAPNAKKVTGRHVHCILLDDPNDAASVEALHDAELEKINNWHDGTLPTRYANPKTGVKIVIQQRLHENDLSGHIFEQEDWEILCLPERYDPNHQFVWPDDPRAKEPPVEDPAKEGPLLWPERIGATENEKRFQILGAQRAAGQLQQEPAPREGTILKRAYWNYYDADILEAVEEGDVSGLPSFAWLVCSWDTAFKDKTTSDRVAGGVWGIHGPDRYLLRVFYDRAALAATKTQMLTMRSWCLARWPNAGVTTLIENRSNGPDIIAQLRREIPGVEKYDPKGQDKTQRANSAQTDISSGNVFIAGAPAPPHDELGRGKTYVPFLTPPWAQEVVEQCARFPKGKADDLVDMTTQVIIWVRSRALGTSQLLSPADIQMPAPSGIPTGLGSMVRS